MSTVDQVAEAVLYEGYLLFPYRPTARKNQQRWTFGGVYPRGTDEPAEMQTQCLLRADAEAMVQVMLRFLHICTVEGREEAIERRFAQLLRVGQSQSMPIEIGSGSMEDRTWGSLSGSFEVTTQPLLPNVWQVTVLIRNATEWGEDTREHALRRTFVSTHTILRALEGEFVSLLEPPDELRSAAESCRNVGTWPVLVDNARTMLSSPIILYDYPQVSCQSPGALFDTTEIDELLTLSVLALSGDEKAEIMAADARGRELLQRSESLTPEQILQLHGVMRELR